MTEADFFFQKCIFSFLPKSGIEERIASTASRFMASYLHDSRMSSLLRCEQNTDYGLCLLYSIYLSRENLGRDRGASVRRLLRPPRGSWDPSSPTDTDRGITSACYLARTYGRVCVRLSRQRRRPARTKVLAYCSADPGAVSSLVVPPH